MIGGSIFASAGLAFWFGVKQIVEENIDNGTVVSVSCATSAKEK